MKTIRLFSIALMILMLFGSCKCKIIEDTGRSSRTSVDTDTTRMVIRYPAGWDGDQRKKFREDNHFKTDSADIERCDCGESNIELLEWDFDKVNLPPGAIQTSRTGLKSGGGGAQGDEPFTMEIYPLAPDSEPYRPRPIKGWGNILDMIPGVIASISPPSGTTLSRPDTISDVASAVNIAIIDTGLNLNDMKEFGKYLYPTKDLVSGCEENLTESSAESGWNFVHNNADVWDNHGHGTYVARIIARRLKESTVPFRILPIKAFDLRGKAKYMDMICALNYIKKVNDTAKEPIHIVNASFGYGFAGMDLHDTLKSNYLNNSIFKSLIEELAGKSLITASAGNSYQTIDVMDSVNLPASFISENIIGVGGYGGSENALKSAGNYGPVSLDVSANYNYTLKKRGFLFFSHTDYLQGSSFSTARSSATVAEIFNHFWQAYPDQPWISSPAVVKDTLLKAEPNRWVEYFTGMVNKIDQGRYIPD